MKGEPIMDAGTFKSNGELAMARAGPTCYNHGVAGRFSMAEMLGAASIVAAILPAILPTIAGAQDIEFEDRLANASRVDCVFTTKVTGDWEAGQAAASVEEERLEASFFDIDVDSGTAEAEGQFGATYIVVRFSYGYLHFMQMSNVGPLYVTTVLARESSQGRLMAVHTRHEYSPTVLPGFTSRPEMYLGDCSVSA